MSSRGLCWCWPLCSTPPSATRSACKRSLHRKRGSRMNRLKLPKLSRRLMQNLVLIGVLLTLGVFFTAMNPRFLTERNFVNIVRQILPAVLMGCSMTFVINSGAIDLSVGGVMALSAVMFGTFVKWGADAWVSVGLVCVLGMAVGALNTVLVHGLKLPSIMATM